ncbi:MAG: NUDIX hydrolase [Melioribacteraceae bacterium]
MKKLNFKVLKTDIVHRGRVFDLKIDEIVYDSGNMGYRETAVHPGGAVVLPVKDDGDIIFVNQFRFPHNQFVLELPAGKLDNNEDPFLCAKRELTEETGYSSENITKLGAIFTTPGFSNEVLHIYLAKELKEGEHNREEGEFGMEVISLSLKEVEEKIKSGAIVDAKTICGILYYKLSLNN